MGSQCCKCQSSNNKPTSASSASSYFGEPLRRGEQELVGERYRVSENNNTVLLSLQHVTRDDVGQYSLTAKNAAGEARRNIELRVEDTGGDVPVFLRRLSDLAVKVGTRTRFLVEIRSSSEAKVTWHRNDEQLQEGERFHFVHEGNFFCVDVAPVMVEDGGRWTCMAEGPGGRTSCSSHLNVLVPKAYKAPEFLEELQALLTEQGTVSLECKVVGVPTPVLHWYKDGQEIKAGDVFALTANPDDPTSLGTYTCEAVNCMGKTYSSSKVHVVGKGSREGSLKPADSMKPVGPPPVFKQDLRNEKIKIGDTITLACQVSVPPWPQSITWYNKEGRVDESDKYHIMADGLGGYMMEINQAEADDEGEWKCVATSNEGARGISTCRVSMTYPKNYRKPRFLESLKAILTDEGLVSFECKVVGFPTPQLRWFKDGQELKPGDVYQLTGTNSLGSYSCIAKNCMGEATSSAELTVEDIQNQLNEEERLQLFSTNQPPKFIVGLKSCEAKIAEDFRFTIQVSISPEPSISWYRDDEQVERLDRYIPSRETLGTCHLDIRSLEIIDQAEWKCVATNEFGHSVTSCFLKLIIPRHFKKPRFLECLRAILSEEGAVNLECKVIGVPQPILKWYKDGEELKPGDIHRIISGQDGTCCLGTYTCEARNCMGIVTSSASLLGFEERLMKGASPQQKLEQGHMIARNPSLSTIHEERTSQMYDTPATERSVTVDERAEVSFSFDGKEVSVSLYETPDLTEEEALQVVEMYADQLSEHVSEHNVVELPPLRFVKETSNTGKLLMEAVVIDVTHDAFGSAAEDDLRTDADLEEFSITDDNGQQVPPLPHDVEEDEAALLEKLNTDFLERALAPTIPYEGSDNVEAPKRPPRRSEAKPDSDTFHSLSPIKGQQKESDTFYSISPTKGGRTPKEEEDRSEHFTDAEAYTSQLDSRPESFASARGSSGEARAFQIAAIEEKRAGDQSTKSSPADLVRNIQIDTKKKQTADAEILQAEDLREAEPKEISSRPGSLKKKMRSVESGLGRSFEESTEEKAPGELPGPKPERPARRGSRSRKERSIESGQGGSFEESDEPTSSEASASGPRLERRVSQKKKLSTEVGLIEAHMKKIQEQQTLKKEDSRSEEGEELKKAKPGEIKRSSGKERRVSTEVQTEGSIKKKRSVPKRTQSVEAKGSEDTIQKIASKERFLSSSSVDLPTLQATVDAKAVQEIGEGSLIESLTRSLQDIQKGLASVEEQVKLQSGSEPGSAKSSLSVLEALTQPIQDSLALVEGKASVETSPEEHSPGKLLETISQPIQEFQKGLALVEQQIEVEMGEESLLERTSVSILENVAQPVQELQRDIALIQLKQQFAENKHEEILILAEEPLPEETIKPALETITQSIQELQRGIAVLQQHTAFEDTGETTSKIDSSAILATLSHPLHELRRGLAEVEQQAVLEKTEEAIGHSILEAVALPLQELQKGLELVEQQIVVEIGSLDVPKLPSQVALQTLSDPVEELKKGLAQIGQAFLIETEPSKPLPGTIPVLKTLEASVKELQHGVESVSRLKSVEETTGKTVLSEVTKLDTVEALAQPLVKLQKCLTDIEIKEFKSKGEYAIATEKVELSIEEIVEPLSELKKELTKIEKQIVSGSSEKMALESARTQTVQSLIQPIRALQQSIEVVQEIVSTEKAEASAAIVDTLVQPLQSFTETLIKIEQEAILESAPKLTTDKKSLSSAKVITQSLQDLQKAILTVEKSSVAEVQEEQGAKVVSKLAELVQPLAQLKQGLVEAVQATFIEESGELVSKKSPRVALECLVQPLTTLEKELAKTEQHLVFTMKKANTKDAEAFESLLQPIQELQKGVSAIKHQATETTEKPSLSIIESLVQPLQSLQMRVTFLTPKESSLLVLEDMSQTVEALQHGVATIEKQVLSQSKQDPSRVVVTKLGVLVEPLKELQKELNLVEQKIQFESAEELATEVTSISALRSLAQPLQELQRGLVQIEHLVIESDVKPIAERAAEVLVEPVLELQRGLHVIQQQAILEADTRSSKGFTILETLAQPLRELQRGLTTVEEQNVMTLEEAPIFEKAATLSALEKITQSVQELNRGIATIEHRAILETGSPIPQQASLSALKEIAKPLLELHKGLIQVEDQMFEPGDKPLPDRSSIQKLEVIGKPLQELTRGLAQVEQALVLEPAMEITADKASIAALQTLAQPLQALQKGIAVVQYQTALEADTTLSAGESVFQTLAQPLQDLQRGIAVVQEHVVMEPPLEQLAGLPALETLAQSIEEIHKGIALVENQAIFEGGEEAISEKTAISVLETIAQPLKELQKKLARVEHHVLLEAVSEREGGLSFVETLANPVRELQKGLVLIEQHAILEAGAKPISGSAAISMVKAIAQPIHEIHAGLAQIQEQVVMEAREVPMSERTEISVLKTLAKPIQQLQKSLAVIEHQAVLEGGEPLSKNFGVSMLETLAQPLKELHRNLVQVEQQVVLEAGDRSIATNGGLSLLETIAHPVQELQRGIALIQQQAALEAREVDLSDKSAVSVLKTLARPMQELQRGLAQIEQQIVMETREEPMTEMTDLSFLKTLAQPIKEIQKSIAVIEQQTVFEPIAEPISEVTSVSLLKTLAHPLHELQKNLVQIQQQVALEAKDQPISEISLSALKTLAQPVQEIQRGIAIVQQQATLEAGDEEMSDHTSISMLQTLAQPLEELQRGIAQIQLQVALEARAEEMSEMTNVSILQALAKPIQELHRGIALIQQQAVFEGGVESISEKASISVLQTLAQPVQELLKGIAVVQQQAPVEHGEELSEKENVSVLKTLAQPMKELHRGLAQVEQQVALEAGVERMPKQSFSILETLAQPIHELQRGITLIEKQAILEGCEMVSEGANLSLLKTLAKPLQELQKGIVMVEQQQVMEGAVEPLSDDATNISDLPTLASTTEVSQELELVRIEEQRALEGDVDTLSDRTDPKDLASIAISYESRKDVAVVHQQTALEGRTSELKTEISEHQVAHISQEIGRESAVVKEYDVLMASSNSAMTEKVETEIKSDQKQKYGGEIELKVREEEEIVSKKQELEPKKTKEDIKHKLKEKDEIEHMKAKEEIERKEGKQEETVSKKEENETETEKKNEQDQAECKKQEETGREQKEAEHKQKEDVEIVKKEKEEATRKEEIVGRKEKEEKERINKEKEAELKKQEEESVKKENVESDRKKKEERLKKEKEDEKKEDEKKKEEERIKREKEDAERKKKEDERLKREKEEAELKNKNEEERVRKEKEEAELKEKEEAERKKKEEEAVQKKEQKRVKKEKEEAELKKKEEERVKKEKEEAELKKEEEDRTKKEMKDAERKKKEEEKRIKKEKEEAENKKKEEHIKKEKEEAELKKKQEEDRKKEKEEAERKKKEEESIKIEEAEWKKKEELRKEEEAQRRKEEEVGRKKEKVEAEHKEEEDSERKIIEQEEAVGKKQEEGTKRKMKEQDGEELKKKEVKDRKKTDSTKNKEKERTGEEAMLKDKGHEVSKIEESKELSAAKSEVTKKRESLDRRRRSKADAEETSRTVRDSKPGAKAKDDEKAGTEQVEWVASGVVQKTRSFEERPWTDDESLARRRQYDDSVDSTETITYSSSSSTLTPTRIGADETRRITVREKVESGPRDARKKPTFATKLTDRTAAQGSRIKLTCSVVGSPDPAVHWLRDGLPLDEKRYRTRCEDGLACLEVLNATPGDSGEYSCVARNLHGEASTTATLRVFAGFEPAPSPPTFTRSIKDTYRFADDELVLECRVRSHPPPKITWLKDGVPVEGSSRHQQTELAEGLCRLTISSPDAQVDSGQYTCRAENNFWSEQISTTVQFAGREAATRRSRGAARLTRDVRRPHMSNVLTDDLVPSGGTFALQVEIKGAPKLDVTWMRGSEPLQISAPRYRTWEESGVYTLMVSDATEKEAGLYTCRASNLYGNVDTCARVGIVPHGSVRGGKPGMFINRPDMDMSVAVGEDISVSFRVTGDPKPKVTWMKGIKDITNSQRSLKETMDDYVRLTLKRALLADAGTYCILAKNVYGCDRAFFTVTMRMRARSMTPSLEWNSQLTSNILRDIRDDMEIARMKDVPGPVAGEPVVIDSGRNWLTLSWPKSEIRGGAPVLAYRVEAWPLGGDGGARWVEMGVSPINTFDAFNLKAGTEYKFRVTPRNRYGWGESVTTSAPVAVGRKVELPEFTRILPGQLKALRGTNIRLECQVKGDPVPQVRWYRDAMELTDPRFETEFDGSRCCALSIRGLSDEDSGRYMCEATNKVGRVSTFARLFVVNDPKILEADHKLKRGIQDDQEPITDTPPQFTMRLRDRRVQMTYPVRLTCQVVGRPTPELTWSKDGEPIKADEHHVFWNDDNFHTLEMSHTKLEDSGSYSATARNANGAVSCHCHLVVDKGIRAYVAPEFLYELEPEYSVREGGELRLWAQVEAYPTVGVMWHRDGVRLRPSRHIVMTLNHDGTVELALAGVTSRDAGVYSCTATNEVGRAETSGRVDVKVAETTPPAHCNATLPQVIAPETPYSKVPLFVTKPRSTEAVEGDTVIILCEVVGDPKPEVVWLRDWLKPDYYRDAPHFRRVGDGPQYRLEIPRAKLDYTGAYSVIARNCHGEAKAVISLQIYAKGQGKEDGMDHSSVKHGTVQTLPVIRRELKDLRCCDGDAVTLECRVQATPTPDIRWEKDGRLLPLGGDFSTELDGETARLHIHQVYPEDEGEYTCVAYNELGRALTSACLVVDVPEEKETLLSRQLSRPPGLLSAGSTPRSTPRTTPSRSKSPSIPRQRDRESTPSRFITESRTTRRLKVAAPKFYAVPHNRVAEEGETVRFQCAIAGHPTPWVTWDKDGILVTPSARLTLSERDDLRILEISEVTVEDAGFYRVTLENEVGRVEASARLEVIGRYGGRSRGVRAWSASPRTSPTFGRRLIGSAARVGSRLTLACDVRGSPTPSTTWYRNGEMVVRSSRATPTWDGRTARLELEDLEPDDAGMYTCVAHNEAGTSRCSARVQVLAQDDPSDEDRQPPVFLQGLPPETMATDGDVLELQVRLQGSPPLDVVWVKDSVEIPDCADFRYVDHGDGRFALRLADIFPQDSGEYRCEAYNEHGDAFTIGTVRVSEGSTSVQFSKKPTPVLASPGGTATFCARLHGCSARTRVSWTVAGRPADADSSRYKVESEGDVHILHVCPVELCDSGQVTCVARGGMSGDDECVTARTDLTVTDDIYEDDGTPAMLIRGPSDTTALRGDRVVLKATYVGNPHPLVRWLRAGHELSSGGRVTITTEDGVACLVIEHITADDSGKYVVSVENNLGADCHFASVAVEGPADPPAGRPSVSASGSSVNVAWCSSPYDGGCMVTGYSIEMRRLQDQDWQVVTNRCHSLSYMVPGLTPGEQYVFRVRAENAHGLSEASSESEPFQIGPAEEESFLPAFEPRVVTIVPGEEFKNNFEVLEELGKGRYGVVHKVQELRTAQKFAAKFIRCIKAKDREKVQEEIDIMNDLRHPKLLQLAAAYESPREIVMVMEYISGGELFERVVADDFTLTERDCILFMRQICEGVDYMHQNYIVHLDLKPENIMCHTRTSHQIKLIDFGLAQKINPDTPVRVLFGTPEFIPPEIINYEPIGVESDMWSVGVICYVLLSGLSPFMGDNDAETFANITRADYDFDDEAFDAISQDAKDFISALLVKRKEKRLTAKECLQHTWLAQHDENMSCVKLCTDKLKKFIIRRKWQLNLLLKRQTA